MGVLKALNGGSPSIDASRCGVACGRCARGAGVDVGMGGTALEVIGGAAENTDHAPSGAYAFIDEIVCTHHRPGK